MGDTRIAAAGGRWRNKLVVVPLVCLGLAFAGPAQADAPNAQGAYCSGKPGPTLPAPAVQAPQTGRPAGIQGGRKV